MATDWYGITRTAPLLKLFANQLGASVGQYTPLRIRQAVTLTNATAQYSRGFIAVDRNSGGVQSFIYASSGILAGLPVCSMETTKTNTNLGAVDQLTGGVQQDTLEIISPTGWGGWAWQTSYGLNWPTEGSMNMLQSTIDTANNTQTTLGASTSDWGIVLGGLRAGSLDALTCTFTRLKIEAML